jgi:CheY-like chemotaxis protein
MEPKTTTQVDTGVIQTADNTYPKYDSVMLIDDNTIDTFINRKLIENNGFSANVSSYNDAREALDFLKQASQQEWPDLIFLDIMMPEMDGFAFLEAFERLDRGQKDRIKIVMLSTSESFKDLNRANKNVLVRKFLNKPLSPEMLKAISV